LTFYYIYYIINQEFLVFYTNIFVILKSILEEE